MASLICLVLYLCSVTYGLSPPGPDFKDILSISQGSIEKHLSDVEQVADSALVMAKSILEDANVQTNLTIVESQGPLMKLLGSLSKSIMHAISEAQHLGANVTHCFIGQEEAAKAIVSKTASTVTSCVSAEMRKAVELSTKIFTAAYSAKNMLIKASGHFISCLPSAPPSIEGIARIPSCIGLVLNDIRIGAKNTVKILSSYLAKGEVLIHTFKANLKLCAAKQVESGKRGLKEIDEGIIVCVQGLLKG